MARSPIDEESVLDAYTTDDVEKQVDDREPAFALAKGMSIPVPKKMGSWWHEKINSAGSVYDMEWQKWDAVYQQYRMCGDEGNIKDPSGNQYKYHYANNTDENIVRINIRTLMRSTYMRNPHLTFSGSATDTGLAECIEYSLNFLMNKKTHPGLNVKPKARRWIMHGQMTNLGVMRLDFQGKEGSLEEAREELLEIEERIKNAKTKDEIDELLATLQVLYERMPLLDGKGMLVDNVLPHRVIVDPDTTQVDLSDCKWLAEECFLDRDYVDQKYYFKEGEELKLRSKPEYSKKAPNVDTQSVEESVLSTVMNDETDQRRQYVQKNKVRCYYIYDKMTRRCYLFNSEDWSWPLWVYDDDLKLSRFFRHFILSFAEPIDGIVQPGEVSYYIGQINTINKINNKAQEIRNSVFGALLYDKSSVDQADIKKLVAHLRNPKQVEAFGITKSNGENKKLSELVEVFAPPALEYQQLFDTNNLRSMIDRASAMSDVDRGEQFKANTTNDAVSYYAQNKQQSMGMLIDIIEDAFEDLGWAMSEIFVSKYSKEDVTALVGTEYGAKFTPMTVPEFNQQYRMTLVAGSIEKPNTEFKKKEAIQIAQSLGQIGQGAPATTLKLIIRMFKEAFSSFVIKDKDWTALDTEATANLNKGVSTNGQAAGQQPPAPQPRQGQQ